MNENNKTITTQLTHDIIKKDFFALHVSYLKIVRNLFLLLMGFVYAAIWIFALLPMENKTLAIILALPFWGVFLIGVCLFAQWIRDIFRMVTKRYQVVTDYVQQRRDRFELKMNFQWYQHTYRIKSVMYGGRPLDQLFFSKKRYFALENHIYYKWSPMFELTDDQIFEHAQLGAKYHLIMVGKNIVMIYNAENFLLEN